MKNNIITILCLLLCNFSVKAQFGIGARVGFSMSTMIGVQGTKLVPNPGATTAVSGEFRLIDKQSMALYIQPEFALEQKGYASRNELSSFWSESHYNFDYL